MFSLCHISIARPFVLPSPPPPPPFPPPPPLISMLSHAVADGGGDRGEEGSGGEWGSGGR